MPACPRRPSRLRAVLALALATLLPAAGCGSEPPSADTAVDRETFIATWIDLRQAALASGTGDIGPSQRQRILDQHGVTPEGMQEFARVRGDEPGYMLDVWEEIERRMRVEAGELPADSGSVTGSVPRGDGAA